MSNSGNVSAAVIEALCTMSDGDYTTAAEQWRALLSPTESRHRHGQDGGDQDPASEQEQAEDQVKAGEEGVTTALTTGTADGNYLDSNATKGKEMIKHNLAVCLLYTGKIDEVGLYPISGHRCGGSSYMSIIDCAHGFQADRRLMFGYFVLNVFLLFTLLSSPLPAHNPEFQGLLSLQFASREDRRINNIVRRTGTKHTRIHARGRPAIISHAYFQSGDHLRAVFVGWDDAEAQVRHGRESRGHGSVSVRNQCCG